MKAGLEEGGAGTRMSEARKPGRPPGTIKDDSKTAVVRFRCQGERKGKWVKKAQSQGKTLTAWIEETLDKAP